MSPPGAERAPARDAHPNQCQCQTDEGKGSAELYRSAIGGRSTDVDTAGCLLVDLAGKVEGIASTVATGLLRDEVVEPEVVLVSLDAIGRGIGMARALLARPDRVTS